MRFFLSLFRDPIKEVCDVDPRLTNFFIYKTCEKRPVEYPSFSHGRGVDVEGRYGCTPKVMEKALERK